MDGGDERSNVGQIYHQSMYYMYMFADPIYLSAKLYCIHTYMYVTMEIPLTIV